MTASQIFSAIPRSNAMAIRLRPLAPGYTAALGAHVGAYILSQSIAVCLQGWKLFIDVRAKQKPDGVREMSPGGDFREDH